MGGDNFIPSVEDEDGSDVDSCDSSKGQHKLDFSESRDNKSSNPFSFAKDSVADEEEESKQP